MLYPKYISDEGLENLKQYKYNGVDNSLCGRLFLNAYWEFVVSKIPTWVAPNVLTLCGLAFIAFGALLSIYFAPTYTEEIPSGVPFIYAVLVFLYQTADNVDGKQARRTKTGSPLGELFDHGVDAIVMGLTTMMVCSVLHAGSTSSVVTSIIGLSAYWFSHWEEYHSGILVMGELTGPTELNLYEIVLYLFGAIFGTGIFSSSVLGSEEMTVATVLQVVFCVASFTAIGKNIHGVYKCISEGRDAHGCASFGEALKQTVLYVVFICLSLLWVLQSPLNIELYPHWYILAVTIGAGYMSQRLITQRVCKEPIKQVVSPVVIMIIAALNSVFDYNMIVISIDPNFVLFVVVFILIGIEGVFSVSVVKQMCAALHIEPFRINPLPPPQPLQKMGVESV